MGLFVDLLNLLVSVVVGLAACFNNLYMVAFVMNFKVPYLDLTTVDATLVSGDPPRLFATPLWNNLLILFGFGFQHTGMIRGPVKYLVRLILSEDNYRVFFVASTTFYLTAAFYFWTPMPYLLWDVQQQQARQLIYALSFLSWFSMALSMMNLDALALLGIRPHLNKVLKREIVDVGFVTTGVYGLLRHPTYTFLILSIWITPTLTVGHVFFSAAWTGYIMFAVAHFEEPDLVKSIGPKYLEYMKTTPRYIPNFFTRSATKKL